VREAERVPHFVSRNESDQLAHDFVLEVLRLSGRVNGCRLHHVPVAQQLHHIVEPADIAFQDLAGARIMHVRTVGILDVGGEVTNDRIAGVFRAEVRILFRCRSHLANNGILETSCLEGFLPVVHAIDQRLTPFLRRVAIDVVHDLLDWLDQLAAGIGLWIRRLETPACDVALLLGTVLLSIVFREADREHADALITQTRLHWILRQEQHGLRHFQRDRVGRRIRRSTRGFVRQDVTHLQVAWE